MSDDVPLSADDQKGFRQYPPVLQTGKDKHMFPQLKIRIQRNRKTLRC